MEAYPGYKSSLTLCAHTWPAARADGDLHSDQADKVSIPVAGSHTIAGHLRGDGKTDPISLTTFVQVSAAQYSICKVSRRHSRRGRAVNAVGYSPQTAQIETSVSSRSVPDIYRRRVH